MSDENQPGLMVLAFEAEPLISIVSTGIKVATSALYGLGEASHRVDNCQSAFKRDPFLGVIGVE